MSRSPASFVRLPLACGLTPLEALERLRFLSHPVLLESCGGARRSLLCAGPVAVRTWTEGASFDPFAHFRRIVPLEGARARRKKARLEVPGFAGGWIGYVGYEVADALERLPPPPPADDPLPTAWWGAYEWAVVWGPGEEPPRLEGSPLAGGDPAGLRARMDGVRRCLEGERPPSAPGQAADARPPSAPRQAAGARPPSAPRHAADAQPPSTHGAPSPDPLPVTSSLGREGYLRGVERIREYIRAGDLFQANLTHRLSASWDRGGVALYRELRGRSPAEFAAYLDTGLGEVVSISPESFLSVRGTRVQTRPIKGTAPRDPDPGRDAASARALEASEKDRAENVMIVDLLRNDLSRVCRAGTVRVPRLLELETHPTVHHLVSTVEGRLADRVTVADLLRATLPGGSISGAPKIRAMEILRELEPARRGVYTGALGVVEADGDLELSIAIRTATLVGGTATYGTGGGITLASDPEAEWRESLDKAAPFLQALGANGVDGVAAGPPPAHRPASAAAPGPPDETPT